MSYPHIITEIVNRPLMVTPAKLEVILSLLGNHSGTTIAPDLSALLHMNSTSGQEIKAYARPVNQLQSDEENEEIIEIIPVLGSLVARNHGWSGDGSGLRSYRTIMMDLKAAARNPQVAGIMLDLDTFGGMSAGCERCTRLIAEVAQEKPVYGVVDLNAYSAGYSIASACSRVILTDQTAGVGSIGCIAIHCDVSKWADQEGLNYTVVTFGTKKGQFSPLRSLSKDDAADLQRSVDAHGLRFAETVAELRGLKLEAVLATEAGAFSGQQAIELGLADDIMSFDEAAMMLADEIATRKRASFTQSFQEKGGTRMPEAMTTKQRMEKLLTAEDGPAAIKDLGFLGKEEAEGAQTDAVNQARAEMIEIAELCQLGEMSVEGTVALLKSGVSSTLAREHIQAKRAEKSQKQSIKSTITSHTDEKHPLVAACEKLAAK
jgi:ClpP class serine protease